MHIAAELLILIIEVDMKDTSSSDVLAPPRIRQLVKHRDISVNKLFEEFATISIAEFDAESSFCAMASRGSTKKGLALLSKLDAAFSAMK